MKGLRTGIAAATAWLMLAACAEGEIATLEPVFGGHVFDQPVELVALSDGRFLVAEQAGRLWEVRDDGGSIEQVLDLTDVVAVDHNEHGFLSVALDPGFEGNQHIWTYSIRHSPRRSALVRYTWPEGEPIDRGSELVALEVPQPFEAHKGGSIRFGPDGMLYLGLGDGGVDHTGASAGQDVSQLTGAIVRIDVRHANAQEPYRVPPDNPFVGVEGARPEIWAHGFRNPWRMSFDEQTGELWVGDVGHEHMEEIDIVRRGGNYGWAAIEGTRCHTDACEDAELVAPVHTYNRDTGCSVTGGMVYRGDEIAGLQGRYVFGDFCEGTVWALTEDGERELVARAGAQLVSFAVSREGELYLVRFYEPIVRLRAK
jgi:glucose/arabinose dehydrogenase